VTGQTASRSPTAAETWPASVLWPGQHHAPQHVLADVSSHLHKYIHMQSPTVIAAVIYQT